jgi:hypothetical protein
MAELFGFEIKRKKEKELASIVSPAADDGSTIVNSAGGYFGMVLDLDSIIKNENDLIKKYREIAQYPDCDAAIEDIVNESIVSEDNKSPINIVLDTVKVSPSIKNKIQDEFANVLKLLKFEDKCNDMFRSWYIDGRLYYHILIDLKKPKDGIVELRVIDPRKIRKIKEIVKERGANGTEVVTGVEEYYIYNDKGITEGRTQGIRLSLDSVIFVPSGIVDNNTGMTLGHLHKAIKPVNQLKMIEDSLVIYRITRAPERRVFYIDVGNLPKLKAEQYVNDIMNKFKNKVVYDATTGEVKDDRKHLSMLEDFWMPRREGGKGTEITTLQGGQSLANIDDVDYFQNKLYQALSVPVTRLRQDTGFTLGKASEITRDEVKFSKFINRLRKKFSKLFLDTLRVQLISKAIISPDDWEDLSLEQDIKFDFMKDNFFAELKGTEILQGRLNMLQAVEPYVGKYYSVEWVRKNVLHQTDEEIEEIDGQIDDEQEMIAKLQFAATPVTQQPDEVDPAAEGDTQNVQGE